MLQGGEKMEGRIEHQIRYEHGEVEDCVDFFNRKISSDVLYEARDCFPIGCFGQGEESSATNVGRLPCLS